MPSLKHSETSSFFEIKLFLYLSKKKKKNSYFHFHMGFSYKKKRSCTIIEGTPIIERAKKSDDIYLSFFRI